RNKRLRQRQPEASLQQGLVAHDGLLGLQQGFDTAAGLLVQPCSSVGKFRSPRRSLQQLHFKLPFQVPYSTAEPRKRDCQTGSRGRKAACLNDGNKYPNSVQIHGRSLPYLIGILPITAIPFHI